LCNGFDEVKRAKWTSTASVKELYATASVVSAERIVFNLTGNQELLSRSSVGMRG